MKSKISYSTYVIILTATLFLAFVTGILYYIHKKPAALTLLALFLVLAVPSALYGAWYIKVTKDNVIMGSPLRSRKIPVRNIASVELYQPTLGAIRIFASGGFMGYWGMFREGDIGRYYAFYGKASDCFLIRMKNGDKYVLGCDKPAEMVDYIKSLLITA